MNESMKLNGKLVNADQLLKVLFAAACRPSLRWLRSQTKAEAIPHVRIGHLVFFDVEVVRRSLAQRSVGPRLTPHEGGKC